MKDRYMQIKFVLRHLSLFNSWGQFAIYWKLIFYENLIYTLAGAHVHENIGEGIYVFFFSLCSNDYSQKKHFLKSMGGISFDFLNEITKKGILKIRAWSSCPPPPLALQFTDLLRISEKKEILLCNKQKKHQYDKDFMQDYKNINLSSNDNIGIKCYKKWTKLKVCYIFMNIYIIPKLMWEFRPLRWVSAPLIESNFGFLRINQIILVTFLIIIIKKMDGKL